MCLIILLFFGSLQVTVIAIDTSNSASPLCGLKTNEMIERFGYLSEVHRVTTTGGYILTLFRCNSRSRCDQSKRPVIVQHGFLCSSDDFTMNTPKRALAYVLADAGYDVWLCNSRGNYYSRKHRTLRPEQSRFWDFSWHEMGVEDQSSIIDYILKQTKRKKLHYVGHSQGTTTLMVLLSLRPEYNRKIRAASLMSPVGFMADVIDAVKGLAQAAPNATDLVSTELLPRGNTTETKAATKVCTASSIFCDYVLGAFLSNASKKSIFETILCHYPSGSSYKQLLHYFQEVKYGFFGKYMCGSKIPSNYPLHRITAPLGLHFSTGDGMADVGDVHKLIPLLGNVAYIQQINDTEFTHMDFLWADTAADLVYSRILSLFDKF